MNNPLLELRRLPNFPVIEPKHFEPAIDAILKENKEYLAKVLSAEGHYNWANLMQPLEDMSARLNEVWAPIGHLFSVKSTAEIREAYNQCRPKVTAYSVEISQNEILCNAIQSVADSPEFATLNAVQRKIIENDLRDFRLSGISLPADKKQRFADIEMALSALTTKFSENVLDAEQAWHLHIENESDLAGIPADSIIGAAKLAKSKGKLGWMFALEYPDYNAIMTYADSELLRRKMYEAYCTVASEQGPNAGQFDNSKNMEEIVSLRHELAKLVGFDNYAEYSIETKMAKSTDEVIQFLYDLAAKAKPVAKQELAELKDFVKNLTGQDKVESWSMAYYSEKLREAKYAFSEEEIKPYLPIDRVLQGLFHIVSRLYGLQVKEVLSPLVWHESVRFFSVFDANNKLRGQLYMDLYARPQKRDGAWMDDAKTRCRREDGTIQTPVAFLICNFGSGVDDKPALLNFNNVETLFHEFGHCLHHLLTQVEYPSVAGISGVEWDAVELPSQFMENWCWEPEAIEAFSGHYLTDEPLPGDLLKRMKEAKNFQSGMQLLRQIEFSLFDFCLHKDFKPEEGARIEEILNQIRQDIAIVIPPGFNRFANSFSHIFAGGYAAGYYSYKWAEVLSSDAFSLFEEKGIFNAQIGRQFMECILEKGGSDNALELFIAFRGRSPRIDALLRHTGIVVF